MEEGDWEGVLEVVGWRREMDGGEVVAMVGGLVVEVERVQVWWSRYVGLWVKAGARSIEGGVSSWVDMKEL